MLRSPTSAISAPDPISDTIALRCVDYNAASLRCNLLRAHSRYHASVRLDVFPKSRQRLRSVDAWHRNWSWGAIPPPGGTPQRARYFLGQVQYAVPLHLRGLFGPSAGGIDPRWQKSAKILHFFTPCGAKPSGSGGAPPTTLILLRNQRRARASSESPPTWPGLAGPRGVARLGRWLSLPTMLTAALASSAASRTHASRQRVRTYGPSRARDLQRW